MIAKWFETNGGICVNSSVVAYAVLEIGVLLATAKLLAWACQRIRLPGVVGEFAAGVIWGPSLLQWRWPWLYHHVFPRAISPDSLKILSLVTLFGFLVMLASSGSSMVQETLDLEVRHARKVGLLYIITSWALAGMMGIGLVFITPHTVMTSQDSVVTLGWFLSICVAMTAVPIISRVINDYGIAGCPNGLLLMRLSMVMDFLGWVLLAVGAIWTIHHTTGLSLIDPVFRMVVAVLVLMVAGKFYGQFMADRHSTTWFWPSLLGFSAFTYFIARVNLYLGGLLFGLTVSRHPTLRKEMKRQFEGMAQEVFVPLFFCLIGYQSNIRVFSHAAIDVLGLAMLGLGLLVKGIPSLFYRWSGLTWREITMLTFTMNARGGMEIFAALWALSVGIFSSTLFSVITTTAVLTAVTCPITIQWYLRKPNDHERVALAEAAALTRVSS